MKITQVKVYPLKKSSANLKAFASVTFDKCFVVSNIKILEGKNGVFVSFPQQKDKNDEYHDICFPVTADFREKIVEAVLDEFKNI